MTQNDLTLSRETKGGKIVSLPIREHYAIILYVHMISLCGEEEYGLREAALIRDFHLSASAFNPATFSFHVKFTSHKPFEE